MHLIFICWSARGPGILPHSVHFWCLINSPSRVTQSFFKGYINFFCLFLTSVTHLIFNMCKSSLLSFFTVAVTWWQLFLRKKPLYSFIHSICSHIHLLFACCLIHYWHWSFSLSVHSLSKKLRCNVKGYGPNGIGIINKKTTKTQMALPFKGKTTHFKTTRKEKERERGKFIEEEWRGNKCQQKKDVICTQTKVREECGRGQRKAEGIPPGVTCWGLVWCAHTHTHTKLFFLTSENPLSRKTVMSLVAGCKKLSLCACVSPSLSSSLLTSSLFNPFFPCCSTLSSLHSSIHNPMHSCLSSSSFPFINLYTHLALLYSIFAIHALIRVVKIAEVPMLLHCW